MDIHEAEQKRVGGQCVFVECASKWLQLGNASWRNLVIALIKENQSDVARSIARDHPSKNVPNRKYRHTDNFTRFMFHFVP